MFEFITVVFFVVGVIVLLGVTAIDAADADAARAAQQPPNDSP